MKKVGLIYDDIFLRHETPKWHPECKERLIAIIDALKSSDIWDKLIHIKPRKADFKDIEAVHTHDYIERLKGMRTGYADPDTYISANSFETALYAAGAVMEAIDRCKKERLRGHSALSGLRGIMQRQKRRWGSAYSIMLQLERGMRRKEDTKNIHHRF